MKEQGQMFLLGAVLLSATFFATAALQTSTPFVVQNVQSNVDVAPDLSVLQQLEETALDECDGLILSLLTTCVSSILDYWTLHLDGIIEATVNCNGISPLGTAEVSLDWTKDDAQLTYEFDFGALSC